ncbi:hypothetical protein [Catenulispora subtropica]|uniref:GCN5-related N-acetyltransferase n=1 Tax=Catenulispora subtropica TaxID=450798 RepID=A0ABN2R5F8_9ACTN
MTIQTRELDPADRRTRTTLLPVFQAGVAADTVRHPAPTEDFLRFLIGPRPTRHRRAVTAFDGGTPIGYGSLDQDSQANRDMVFADLWILPERRADATRPLLEAFLAYSRGRGCARTVIGFSDLAAPDYDPVFTAAGGRPVAEDWRSDIALAAIDRERYAAWAAPSAKNKQYRVEHWVAPTPEHLLATMVRASQAMGDAPTGDLDFQVPPPDVDRRRKAEAMLAADGVRKHCVAAFTEGGEAAGFHEVFVVPGFPMADVGNTGVVAAHRGHGLGLRLKADLALRLLEAEPELAIVNTWNNGDNEPMLRVNEALGYIKAETWKTWQFDL